MNQCFRGYLLKCDDELIQLEINEEPKQQQN